MDEPIKILWLEFKQTRTYMVPFILSGDKRELTDKQIMDFMDLDGVEPIDGENEFMNEFCKNRFVYETSEFYDIKTYFSELENLMPV